MLIFGIVPNLFGRFEVEINRMMLQRLEQMIIRGNKKINHMRENFSAQRKDDFQGCFHRM